jgi:LL-diaminopimelate aminotransferase
MNLSWITPAERIQKLPPYVFARLDELKAKARRLKMEAGLDFLVIDFALN